jgi:hypothetical protein
MVAVRIPLLAVLLLLVGCSPSEPPSPHLPDPAPTLSWDGYGPIRFGMTVDQAVATAGPRDESGRELDPSCDYIQFASLPGIRFMVEKGVITRGDAGPTTPNAFNISVGARLEAVKAAHPEARITPHKYDPTGHYLLFAAPGGAAGIVMEEKDGAIVRIRAGLEPAVEYVESCL